MNGNTGLSRESRANKTFNPGFPFLIRGLCCTPGSFQRRSANIRDDAAVDGSPTEDAHVAMDEAAPVEGLLLGARGAQMHCPGKALSGN